MAAAIVAAMKPVKLPSFLTDLFVDPVAVGALVAGSAALFAAAMDPQVWSPAQPSVQAAVRDSPQLETLVVLATSSVAALILLGGAIGDSRRSRPIVLGGLTVELLACVVALLFPSGPVFVISRFVGHAGATFVIPVSIALVATSYNGAVRATAIGVAYGAYGLAGAVAPILLQVLPGQQWPAMVAAIAASALAIRIGWTRTLELRRPSLAERPLVVGVALWAFGIIAFTVGLTWVDSGIDNPLRWALIVGGPALVIGYDRIGRAKNARPARIIRRRVAIALFVGVVIAISQTAAMLDLPLYFHLVLGYGPIAATVALAPLFAALVLAGPIAGFLLERVTPRWLVGGGVIFVGLANLVLAAVSSESASYLGFIVPCLVIGAGFAIATTVRTAIIFASVPQGLPATAAALNESSMTVGNRLGVVIVSAVVAHGAIAHYSAAIAGMPVVDAASAIAAFRTLLVAVGTPSFTQVATAMSAANLRPYVEAYTAGLNQAYLACALVGVVGGAIALFAFGREDPLRTVWEYREERPAPGVT
jgi:hypothetical protein